MLERVADRLIHRECFGRRCRILRSGHQPNRSEYQRPADCSSVSLHVDSVVHSFLYPDAVMTRTPVSLRSGLAKTNGSALLTHHSSTRFVIVFSR